MSSSVINCLIFINSDILKNFLKNQASTHKKLLLETKHTSKTKSYFCFTLEEQYLSLTVHIQGQPEITYPGKQLDANYYFDSPIDIYFYGFHNPEIQYDYYFSSRPDDISCVYPLGNNNVTILRGVKKGSLFSDSFYQENQQTLKKKYLTFTKKKEKINYIPPYAFTKRKTHQLIILESIMRAILIKRIQKNSPRRPIKVAIVCPLNQLPFVEKIIQPRMLDFNNLVAIKVTVERFSQMITILFHDENNQVTMEEINNSVDNYINVDWSILGCDLEILIIHEAESPDHGITEQVDGQISSLQQLQQQLQQQQQQQQQRHSKHHPLKQQQSSADLNQVSQLQHDLSLQDVLERTFSESQLMHQLQKVLAFLDVLSKFCNYFFILYNQNGKPTMQNYFLRTLERDLRGHARLIDKEDISCNTIVSHMDHIRRIKGSPIKIVGNQIWFKNLKFYTYIIKKTNIDENVLGKLLGRRFVNYPRHNNPFYENIRIDTDLYFKQNLPEDMFHTPTKNLEQDLPKYYDYLGDELSFQLQNQYQAVSTEEDFDDQTNDFDYYFISSRSQSIETFKAKFPFIKKGIILPCVGEDAVNLFRQTLSTDFTMDWSFYNDNPCPEDSNMMEEVIKIIFYKKLEEKKLQATLESSLNGFFIEVYHMQKLDFCEEVMKDILKFSNEYLFQSLDISNFIKFLISKIVDTNPNVKKKHDKEAYIYINLFILQELIKETEDETFSKFLENTLTFLFKKSKGLLKDFLRIEEDIIQDAIQPYISEQKTIKLKNLLSKAENISHLFVNAKLTFEKKILKDAGTLLQGRIDEIEEYKPEEILPLEPVTKVSRLFPELVNKYILKAVIDIFNTNYHKYDKNSGSRIHNTQLPYDIMMDDLFYKILGVEKDASMDELTRAYENRIRKNDQNKQVLASVRDLLLGEQQQQLNEIPDDLRIDSLPTIQQEQQQQQQQQQLLKKLRRDKLLYKVLGIEGKENEPSIGDTHTNRIQKAYENRIKEINEQSQVFYEVYQFLNVPQNKQLYDANYRRQRKQNGNDNPNDPNYRG